MPWTEADKENVLDAMREIVSGERVVTLTTADRSETRQIATLKELQEILDVIAATAVSAPRPRLLRSRYSKGL